MVTALFITPLLALHGSTTPDVSDRSSPNCFSDQN